MKYTGYRSRNCNGYPNCKDRIMETTSYELTLYVVCVYIVRTGSCVCLLKGYNSCFQNNTFAVTLCHCKVSYCALYYVATRFLHNIWDHGECITNRYLLSLLYTPELRHYYRRFNLQKFLKKNMKFFTNIHQYT